MIDIASGEVEDRAPTPEEQGKNASRVARGKVGGPKGGNLKTAKALRLAIPPGVLAIADEVIE